MKIDYLNTPEVIVRSEKLVEGVELCQNVEQIHCFYNEVQHRNVGSKSGSETEVVQNIICFL